MRDSGKGRGAAKTSRKHFLKTGLQNKDDGQMAGSGEEFISSAFEPELHS